MTARVVLFDMTTGFMIFPLRQFSEIADLQGYADYKFLLYVYPTLEKMGFISRKSFNYNKIDFFPASAINQGTVQPFINYHLISCFQSTCIFLSEIP